MVPWRWWLLPIGILVAMTSASALAGPDRWAATVAWAERIRAAAPPPVSPATAAGLAQAARIAGGVQDVDDRALRDAAAADLPLSPSLAAQWEALQPAIDQLEQALAPGGGGDAAPVVSDPTVAEPACDLWELQKPIDVLLARARRGRPADLDLVLQCVNSLLRSRHLITRVFGLAICERALDVATVVSRNGAPLAAPSAAQLRTADAELSALADVPTWFGLLSVDMVRTGSLAGEELTVRARLSAWQNAFSTEAAGRELVAGVVEQVQAFTRATPAGESWPDRRVRLIALEAADASIGGMRMRALLGEVTAIEAQVRGLRERVQLLLAPGSNR